MENILHTNDPGALLYMFGESIYNIKETTDNQPVSNTNTSISSPSFDYLGENNKYILVLIHNPQSEKIIAKEDHELLLKTLKALSLDMRDIALVNIAHQTNKHLNDYKSYFSPSKLVGFGISTEDLQLEKTVSRNVIQSIADVKILLTDSLAQLAKDQEAKTLWWKAMKTLFQ